MLKEEFSELKLYIKSQPVQYFDISTMEQFIKLHPEIDLDILYLFFVVHVKKHVAKADFVLIVKTIFSRAKA